MQAFFNNAEGVLASAIEAEAESFTLGTGEGDKFPIEGEDDYFYVTIGTEVVMAYARDGDTFECNSVVSGWPAGTKVAQYVTAEMLADFVHPDGGGERYLQGYVLRSMLIASSPRGSASNVLTLDASAGYNSVWLYENVTSIEFENVSEIGEVQKLTVEFLQPAGGNMTVVFPANFKTPGGSGISISLDADSITVVTMLTRDAGDTWLAWVEGSNFS